MKKKIKRPEYKGDVARVPYNFVHCMGKIWAVQRGRIRDFRPAPWIIGDSFFNLYEPYSLSSGDLQNYLALLHVLQHPREYSVVQDEYSSDKYKMTLRMRALYDILQIPDGGSRRSDLKESILNHAGTMLRVTRPENDIIYYGLGLHAGIVKFKGIGRGGSVCELHPDKGLIDNSGLTENITRILTYKYGMSKLIDFLVMGKLDAGVDLSYRGWMEALTREGRIDHFKRDFEPALEEISIEDFMVEVREDGVKIKYKSSKQKALSS